MHVTTLFLMLLQATSGQVEGPSPTQVGHVLADEEYKTACGPIACYVALHKLGDDTRLGTLIEECGWKKDQPVPFGALADALGRHSSVRARAVRLTPEELFDWLGHGNRVAILAIRKMPTQTDHALCAVGVEGSRLLVLDYPEFYYTVSKGGLSDSWNGEAILVVPNEMPWPLSVAGAVVPGTLAGFLLIGFARTRRRK